jgi:hypothetical protein
MAEPRDENLVSTTMKITIKAIINNGKRGIDRNTAEAVAM